MTADINVAQTFLEVYSNMTVKQTSHLLPDIPCGYFIIARHNYLAAGHSLSALLQRRMPMSVLATFVAEVTGHYCKKNRQMPLVEQNPENTSETEAQTFCKTQQRISIDCHPRSMK
jgi:hypothetical protein